MKMKTRSHTYDIIRHRSKHVHNKYSKYKKCLNIMMMATRIKQHLRNI